MTDRLEIVIIELPKAKKLYGKDAKNKIAQWMMFLDDPNEKEVVQIMKENKDIKKAIGELERVSGDEKVQRIAELREKAIMDEKAALAYAIEKGLKQGIEQGVQKTKAEIALNMLRRKMALEDIIAITGLNKKDITKLNDKIK